MDKNAESAACEEKKSASSQISYGAVKQVDKQLTVEDVLRLLAKIDDIQFQSLERDQLTVVNYSLGYFNSVWLITIDAPNFNGNEQKLIFKFYGGNKGAPVEKNKFFDHGYGVKLETTIAKLTSKMSIGPYVHYTDDTCRIEEYVSSETFNFDTFFTASIANNFARKLARYHSLIDEINFDEYDGQSVDLFAVTRDKLTGCSSKCDIIYSKVKERCSVTSAHSSLVNDMISKGNLMLDQLNYVESLGKKLHLKRALINWDLNPLNILIKSNCSDVQVSKESPTSVPQSVPCPHGQPDDKYHASECYLIDYEFAHANYRCIDLGSLIHGAIVQPLTGKQVTDEQMNSSFDYFRDNFLTHYQLELAKLPATATSLADKSIDSKENILLEALFGCCFIWIHYLAVRIDVMFSMCPESAADIFAGEVIAAAQFYNIAKKRLLQLAPHLRDAN